MENVFNILTTIFTLVIAINTLIITRKAFRQEHMINMKISAHVDFPTFNRINIEFQNHGEQVYTIKSISLGIGVSSKNQKILIKKEIKSKTKLNHGDIYTYYFEQTDVRKKYQELNIQQAYNRLLWINITSSLNQTNSEEVNIHQGIIKGKFTYSAAGPFIATDTFLGLPQMESSMPTYIAMSKMK